MMANLIPWNRNEMVTVRDLMDRVFEDFTSNFSTDTAKRPVLAQPPIDIIDHEDHVEIHADLPGIDPENVNIEFNNGSLTISAKVESEENEAKDNFTRRERYFGSYRRTLTIPNSFDVSEASAEFNNGVLVLSIPRSESAKPIRIPVGNGKSLSNGS